MLDVRKFRSYTPLTVLFLFLFTLSLVRPLPRIRTTRTRIKTKTKTPRNPASVTSSSAVRPAARSRNRMHSIEVPDRPGHVLWLGKRKCSWTEPMELMGAKSKDGVAIHFSEEMENALHEHGFEVDTFDNGEKVTMQTVGQVQGVKGPADSKGRWSLMRGTGKFKGIKGGGTYEGKLAADDVLTLEFEGVYDPSEMAREIRNK